MEKLIKACVSVLPKALQNIYYKYEEQFLYIIFGCLTTAVAFAIKKIIWQIPGQPIWENTLAAIVSWIGAVTFAFFTNKKYVFKRETKNAEEFWRVFISFYGSRAATLILDWALFFIFCDTVFKGTRFEASQDVMFWISQVLILIGNYVLGKFFVFRNKQKQAVK